MEWTQIFFKGVDLSLAIEVVARTLIMFALILIVLRATGKRGVRQLSLFEVAIIIGLGSAAGDPMFNPDEPILPAIIVFIVICAFYRLMTWLASKSEKFEVLVEGKALYIIEDGMFDLVDQKELFFGKDEFLAEMRQQNVEHLGQIRTAVLETNGNVSFIFFDEKEVKKGLPIWPKVYEKKSKLIPAPGAYACTYCGNVEDITTSSHICRRCNCEEWVMALDTKRCS